MKLKAAIQNLGVESAISMTSDIARNEGVDWNGGAKFVFSVIARDLERVPGNIGGKNDSEQDVIKKWLLKYQGGYSGRTSQRISNPPGTVADPIIEKSLVHV